MSKATFPPPPPPLCFGFRGQEPVAFSFKSRHLVHWETRLTKVQFYNLKKHQKVVVGINNTVRNLHTTEIHIGGISRKVVLCPLCFHPHPTQRDNHYPAQHLSPQNWHVTHLWDDSFSFGVAWRRIGLYQRRETKRERERKREAHPPLREKDKWRHLESTPSASQTDSWRRIRRRGRCRVSVPGVWLDSNTLTLVSISRSTEVVIGECSRDSHNW